jgi:hypothetical protein
MPPQNEDKIVRRVREAANAALAQKEWVSTLDVLLGMGWLSSGVEKLWRQGRVESLERGVQANLRKLSFAMKAFRAWANERGLRPSRTEYVSRTPDRRHLQFSVSGDPGIEEAYRTHWVSASLGEKKQTKIEERLSKPPALVAIIPLHDDWKCSKCGDTGDLLIMRDEGPTCLACAGLSHLVYLPSGNAKLTRRATATSAEAVVVVRFSRSRKRYERQGMLLEKAALEKAEQELGIVGEADTGRDAEIG